MPEFNTVLTKREIDGVATYIIERIKGCTWTMPATASPPRKLPP